jgi:hypothetical protein
MCPARCTTVQHRRLTVPSFDEIDYFTDESLVNDPYPYFEYQRSVNAPALRLRAHLPPARVTALHLEYTPIS